MNIQQKDALARRGDWSNQAASFRLRAAIRYTGLPQNQFGALAGIAPTTLNNQAHARAFPSLTAMTYLYRAHRIDFNFMIAGEYAQLPGDVQKSLFDALQAEENALDRKSNSDQSPSGEAAAQS